MTTARNNPFAKGPEPLEGAGSEPVPIMSFELVTVADAGSRIAQAGGVALEEAMDFLWQLIARDDSYTAYDLMGGLPNNVGSPGYISHLGDLTCLNDVESDLRALELYALTKDDVERVLSAVPVRPDATPIAVEETPAERTARVVEMVALHGGNLSRAANSLGISRQRVSQIIRRGKSAASMQQPSLLDVFGRTLLKKSSRSYK